MGVGQCVITPPIGTDLFGYAPDVHSTSVHDDLNITAVYLEESGKRAMLLSVEVCLIQNELCEQMREIVVKETGIPGDQIIISATHTHSGPTTVQMDGWGDLNWEYCNSILLPQTAEVAKRAIADPQPVEMGIGTAQSLVGCNRREMREDGSVHLGQRPWGPFDPTMTVLHFRNPKTKKSVLSLIHYCCHGTAAGKNHEITRDWSYAMLDATEQATGATAVFFNGAVGDVGPRLSNGKTVGDITYVEELGAVAKRDCEAAFAAITDYTTDLELGLGIGTITLPLADQPSKAETEEKLRAFLKENPDPESLNNIQYGIYHHLSQLAAYFESGKEVPTERVFRQTLISLGGKVVFVPFPFEVFVEITLNIRKFSPYPFTLCLSNTNGANSYLPTQDQLIRGGYEVKSFYNENLFPFRDDTDDTIMKANVRLLKELKANEPR